ncbi:AAA family ATPase [Rhizobium sp. LEGMi198b]
MRLSKLILQNIKSFRNRTEIDFSAEMNLFIGPNGGGKSNLMNTLSWVLNSRFYRSFASSLHNNRQVLQLQNFSENAPEPHWAESDKPSYVWIEFEVTAEDIKGLRDHWRNKDRLLEKFRSMISWEGNQHLDKDEMVSEFDNSVIDPDAHNLSPGQRFRYKISIERRNRYSFQLVPVDDADRPIEGNDRPLYDAYLRYLTDSDLRKTLTGEHQPFTLPYILYAPSREPTDLSINLSGGANINDIARTYQTEMQNFVFNSRGTSQLLSQVSTFVIGAEYLQNIYVGGTQFALQKFENSPLINSLSDDLAVFGFKWQLLPLNQFANHFQIVIARPQEEGFFSVLQASSGERQLLNFIFGLSIDSIRNSLIIIDEPELNLHPRWQKLLLRFFLRTQKKYNCQFVMSTHSASFLDEKTLPHVRRIYRKNQSSALSSSHHSGADRGKLSEAVKLLNAQQNERIFFTQKAVLVEGQSDFVIWQKLINLLLEIFGVGEIIEVMEVLGSSNFSKYRAFLDLFEIESYIVADQDYVMSVGDDEIRGVFKKFYQENKTCQNLLKTHSLDRLKLVSALETAMATNDKDTLQGVLDYLKARNTKIDLSKLTIDELSAFSRFRNEQAGQGVFVLEKGALESYYLVPGQDAGAIKKDTDKAISFAGDDTAFHEWIERGARIHNGQNPTAKDKIMAEESAEFLTIAMKIIGVELNGETAAQILRVVERSD